MRRVEVSIRFAAGDPCLEGHFPGNPIVPAAAILSELVALVEAELSRTVVEVTRALTSDPDNRVPHLAFQADALADHPILPIDEVHSAYYLRLQAVDRPGVLADVTRILGDRGISIEALLQNEPE